MSPEQVEAIAAPLTRLIEAQKADMERRHLESMAATMAAAFIARGDIPDMTDAQDCVKLARRIQSANKAEVS